MKVPARKMPVVSRPKDFPTSGKWFTTRKVKHIASHIESPPHLGVTEVWTSRERNCINAPDFMAKSLINDVSNKNEIIEQLKNIYGETLINDILYNKDVETQYFYNNILIS